MLYQNAQIEPGIRGMDGILPTLMDAFKDVADDLQVTNLKIKSGFHDVFKANHLRDANGDVIASDDEEDKRQKKRTQIIAEQTGVFNFGGLSLSFDTAMGNLESFAHSFDMKKDANIKSMALDPRQIAYDENGKQIETPEQLRALEHRERFCSAFDRKSASEIMMVNGQPVDAAMYIQVEHENEQLDTEQQRVNQYLVKLKNGDVTFNDLPDDIKKDIADVEEAKTAAPAPEPTVLDQLKTFDNTEVKADFAAMQPVKPSVSFNLTPQ